MKTRRPARLHASLGRVAVAGAATIATVLATSPAAVADADLAPEAATSESGAAQPEATPEPAAEDAPADKSPAPVADDAPTEEAPIVETPESTTPPALPLPTGRFAQSATALAEAADPEYVDQSATVSARIADDAEVVAGTTTVGTTFDLFVNDAGGGQTTTPCTTTAVSAGSTDSVCLFDDGAGGTTTIFDVAAGSSVSVELRSVPEGLEIQGISSIGVTPNVAADAPDGPYPLAFDIYGTQPTGDSFSTRTPQDTPLLIDLADHVQSVSPNPTFALGSDFDDGLAPDHGSYELVDGQQIRYTPDEGYVGPDEFRYSVTDGNGTAFVTVQVNVGDAAIVPNFGSQKYRIGVQIDDGSYVPAGTTTDGSTFRIETTSQEGVTTTTTCTTRFTPFFSGRGASACPGDGTFSFLDFYQAPAGSTVVVTQTDVGDDALLPAADPMVVEPCQTTTPFCPEQSLVFENRGSILPETNDDSAATDENESVVVDVLDNDTSDDPETEMFLDSSPSNGTAEIIGEPSAPIEEEPVDPIDENPTPFPFQVSGNAVLAAVANEGTLAIRYTPDEDFSGVDTFTYGLENGNGSTLATVSVTVRGGEVVDPATDDESAGEESTDVAPADERDGVLPDTGGSNLSLLGIAAALLAGGGALLARARRRSDGTPVA